MAERENNHMKKKIISSILTVAVTLSLLTGCGAEAGNGAGNDTAGATQGTVAADSADDTSVQSEDTKTEDLAPVELTNVSYDPTRELYVAFNEAFQTYWKDKTGQDVTIVQSHGGSGKQALEVANGLEADVVTLALEGDVQAVADAGLIEEGFASEFANDSSPYTSTIVFLVRSGNEKEIYDWDDLIREDVGVITPNPKTSGGARWNFLAAWYYFEQQGLSEAEIQENMKKLYENVLVLDSGARGSTTSFVENKQGDVLLAWENEAFLSLEEYPGEYEIVIPSVSILCQPTVALVDEVVDDRGTREVATEYLQYLYSEEAQRIEADNFYRPSDAAVLADYTAETDSKTITELPTDGKWIISLELTDINHFNGWAEAAKKFFVDGGVFDQIYEQ